MPRILSGIFILCLASFVSSAQYINREQVMEEAISLYEKGHFEAAAPFFEEAVANENEKDRASFYLAMIPLRSNFNPNPLEKYISLTESIKYKNLANRELGYHFIVQADYYNAITTLEKVSEKSFSDREKEEFYYKKGYAFFKTERLERAERLMNRVSYYKGPYEAKANYHLGIIAYEQKEMNEAIVYFENASRETEMKSKSIPFLASIYFQQKRYRELIEFLEKQTNNDFSTSIYLAESYYFLKNYEKSAIWYEKAKAVGSSKISPESYFRYGDALIQQQKYQQAIDQLKIAGLEKSETGQLAAFRLGEVYIKTENFAFAINAFKQASGMDYNESLRQKAILQTARLLMKTERNDEAISILNGYAENYPNGEYYQEVLELTAAAYLNTSDYEKALSYLESTGLTSRSLRETYQEVSYKMGRQLYNDENFSAARSMLKNSLKYPVSMDVTTNSYFLLGENYSVLGEYQEAIDPYRQALALTNSREMKDKINYGLGYAYFNTSEYNKALDYFREFISRAAASDPRQKDALSRIADCYYVRKDFPKARASFKSLTRTQFADYAYFRLGSIAYLEENNEAAIDNYQKVIKDFSGSIYADNAAYQLSKLYYESELFTEAIDSYTYLIDRYSNSSLIPYGLLERGLSYSNTGDLRKARRDLETIIEAFTDHPSVENALLGLQELQKKGLQIDNFDEYLSKVEATTGNSERLNTIEFEQAKTLFFNQSYDRAIVAFQNFFNKYPESPYKTEASYYLADSYYRKGDWTNAAIEFGKVAEQNSIYKTRSLDKKGKAELNSENYGEAINTYHWLSNAASTGKDQFNAFEGLTNAHFALNNYDSAIYYAEQIQAASWKPAIAVHFTNLVKAKSYLKLGQKQQASDLLITVINNATDKYAAEALYMLAGLQFQDKQYRFSIETLFELVGNYGSYGSWTDKGYLLMVDNYIALDELLQAKATANSILENSESQYMKEQAEQKLIEIEKLQSKEVKMESDSLK